MSTHQSRLVCAPITSSLLRSEIEYYNVLPLGFKVNRGLERNMGQDAAEMVLKTSVLGTFRVFMVMLAGLLASKLPNKERELMLSAAYLPNLPSLHTYIVPYVE